jgi:ATP-binding cassette subfamily F protein uup
VALAAVLLSSPDLLILDEPTNHMDLNTIKWMESNLQRNDLTLMLVSHDRAFMEQLCTRMLEIESGSCFLHSFGGAGSYAQMRAMRRERYEAAMQGVANAKNKLRKEADWMSRQPKARSTKSRARIDQFYALKEKANDKPVGDQKAEFGSAMTRLGSKVQPCTSLCVPAAYRRCLS